jgi:hypothetical protein
MAVYFGTPNEHIRTLWELLLIVMQVVHSVATVL